MALNQRLRQRRLPRRARLALNTGRALLLGALTTILIGCTAAALKVSDAGLSEVVDYLWLTSLRQQPKTRFSGSDDKVTLGVQFAPNMIAFYKQFTVQWLAPSGRVYLQQPAHTQWGSHMELATVLPLRGTPAARLPGHWRVRLYLGERLLVERGFEVRSGGETAHGDQPPMAALAPSALDRAAEE